MLKIGAKYKVITDWKMIKKSTIEKAFWIYKVLVLRYG